jgi:two-component system KDP operon response regulator KdpE
MNGGSNDRILIVEDDQIQCEMMRAALEWSGFTCETAGSGVSALKQFKNHTLDGVVADLGLPDCDGVELISIIRTSSDVPVIVVSGHSDEADKIAALDHGADDYLVKPFLPGELAARLRAKLRQSRAHPPGSTEHHETHREDVLRLSRLERALLALLIHRKGETVAEDEIIATIWGSCTHSTSADLRSLVLKLRRKLDEQHQPMFVLNERGVGYYVSSFGQFPIRRRGVGHAGERWG